MFTWTDEAEAWIWINTDLIYSCLKEAYVLTRALLLEKKLRRWKLLGSIWRSCCILEVTIEILKKNLNCDIPSYLCVLGVFNHRTAGNISLEPGMTLYTSNLRRVQTCEFLSVFGGRGVSVTLFPHRCPTW